MLTRGSLSHRKGRCGFRRAQQISDLFFSNLLVRVQQRNNTRTSTTINTSTYVLFILLLYSSTPWSQVITYTYVRTGRCRHIILSFLVLYKEALKKVSLTELAEINAQCETSNSVLYTRRLRSADTHHADLPV